MSLAPKDKKKRGWEIEEREERERGERERREREERERERERGRRETVEDVTKLLKSKK